MTRLKRLLKDTKGATAIEYTLMVALIALALIGGATAFGNAMNNAFNTLDTTYTDATS